MRALILGGRGQLGRELAAAASDAVSLYSPGRDEVDITDPGSVHRAVAEANPDIVINAAAYTAVDMAESEPEVAHAVNAVGAENVARASAEAGARMVHFSTDFVFGGDATVPYEPDATAVPLGVYGRTKLDGEQAVLAVLPAEALILRTSWLYSAYGSNFVKTMIRLMSERDSLSVVGDQIGSPTWAGGLATLTWRAVEVSVGGGIYHWCDAGAISWFDFAIEIQDVGHQLGLLDRIIPISRITTAEYPTAAKRPAFSVLDCHSTESATGIRQVFWKDNLRRMLLQIEST